MATTLMLLAVLNNTLIAQGLQRVPLSIYFPEQVETIPVEASNYLISKIGLATSRNGMGATNEFTQFYITCISTVTDRYVVPGAPTKYFNKEDLNFYVVDAFSKKIFNSYSISVQGVGNSDAKAYIDGFKRFVPLSDGFMKFLTSTSDSIVQYYESQCNNIIKKARTLATSYKYEEALFQLSIYPECCPSYPKILEIAEEIYLKYIDDQAAKNLAKARTIWAAGQDSYAAEEAGRFLAEILPDSKYYDQAVSLSEEMKNRVKSDIDYVRNLEERDNAQEYALKKKQIEAWRAVGEAYGNNQKSNTYYSSWLW